MKFLKWFSLFFVSLGITLVVGIVIGFQMQQYFYPGEKEAAPAIPSKVVEKPIGFVEEMEEIKNNVQMVSVSKKEERIDADTIYLSIERDMYTGEQVETSILMPHLYLGMTREQFLQCMEDYEANPPLSELERGFESLEVLRFSPEKVEVLMNYRYVKPSDSFYIVVYGDKLTVLLDDKKTIYLQTGIDGFDLPEEVRQEIIQGMYVPSEEALYDFLETYTS